MFLTLVTEASDQRKGHGPSKYQGPFCMAAI